MSGQTHDNLLTEFTASGQKFTKEHLNTNDGHQLMIFFFSHATLGFVWDNMVVYVDPLMEYADFAALPKADLILVTHEHYDHYDAAAVAAASTDKTVVVGSPEVGKLNDKVKVLAHDHSVDVSPTLSALAVPAYNVSPEQLQFHPREKGGNGYIISFDGKRVYVAGDTEPIDEMKSFGPLDVMFLPVNQPYTMTVEQAAAAARMLAAPIFYPYHTTDTQIERLKEALADTPEISVRIYPMP